MIERIYIDSNKTVLRSADGTTLFHTDFKYLKTATNGDIYVGGYHAVPTITGYVTRNGDAAAFYVSDKGLGGYPSGFFSGVVKSNAKSDPYIQNLMFYLATANNRTFNAADNASGNVFYSRLLNFINHTTGASMGTFRYRLSITDGVSNPIKLAIINYSINYTANGLCRLETFNINDFKTGSDGISGNPLSAYYGSNAGLPSDSIYLLKFLTFSTRSPTRLQLLSTI